MTMTLGAHQCSYYCHGRTHAVEILADPHLSASRLLVAVRQYCQGDAVVHHLRPAPEAEVDRWAARMHDGVNIASQRVALTHHDLHCSAPWLVFLTLREEPTP